jgi:hypothetical protein
MTASPEIKTPAMSLPLKAGKTEEDAYALANEFYKLMLPGSKFNC